jgi:hypothetical protein
MQRHRLNRLVSVLAGTALLVTALATPALAVGGSEFVRITNEYRASVGKPPVELNASIDRIAVERANAMASTQTFAHDMDYIKQRMTQMGMCWSNVGEIIAYEGGYPTHSYERTMAQWWNSSGHRAIMLGDFNAAGGSWAVSAAGKTYSVMVFVKLCGSSASVPKVATIGHAVIGRGTHTAIAFDGETVVGRMTYTLGRTSGADVSQRAKIDGATYLKIANGVFAGYWLRESYAAYLPGWFDVSSFAPLRLTFDAGTHVGFKYYSSGNAYARLERTLWRRSGADAVGRAVINGRVHYKVANGIWAGYWVPDTASVWPTP